MKPVTSAFLNKSEAAHFLHTCYERYIRAEGLPNLHPDFYSLVNENIRNPNCVSALIAGYPRGNKRKYGHIDHIRMGARPMFSKSILVNWFVDHYVPVMKQAA